ncbi:MAG: hypothetical protein Q8908_14330, partial [Bacteroidota bacterium]|nr:hypothetical protein [Bacteroidota bacterium]
NMETERNIPFLKREFFYSTDYDIRKVAAGALVHCLGPTGIDELTEASSPENRLILSHCMNPLINS